MHSTRIGYDIRYPDIGYPISGYRISDIGYPDIGYPDIGYRISAISLDYPRYLLFINSINSRDPTGICIKTVCCYIYNILAIMSTNRPLKRRHEEVVDEKSLTPSSRRGIAREQDAIGNGLCTCILWRSACISLRNACISLFF